MAESDLSRSRAAKELMEPGSSADDLEEPPLCIQDPFPRTRRPMHVPEPIPSSSSEITDPRSLLMRRMESGTLELPILPDMAAAVLQACRDEDAGARRVAEIVQRDPALAGHVLRLANS